MKTFLTRFFRTFDWLLLAVFVVNFFAIAAIYHVQTIAVRTNDASALRAIVQDYIIQIQDDSRPLAGAKDVWDYARILSEGKGLSDAREWISAIERDYPQNRGLTTIVSHGQITPSFQRSAPGYAVALMNPGTEPDSMTPVAWTRGLRADGTWAKNNPFGGEFGFIVFRGGAVVSYPNLKADGGELQRYGGKDTDKTANILEALPPGSRISEYTPTPEDEAAWFRVRLWQRYGGTGGTSLPILWAPLFLCLLLRASLPKRNLSRVSKTLGLLACLQIFLMWLMY